MAQLVDDRKSATIERRAKLFRGFADPSRLAILGALCNEPLAVHELVERTEAHPAGAPHRVGPGDLGPGGIEQRDPVPLREASGDRADPDREERFSLLVDRFRRPLVEVMSKMLW